MKKNSKLFFEVESLRNSIRKKMDESIDDLEKEIVIVMLAQVFVFFRLNDRAHSEFKDFHEQVKDGIPEGRVETFFYRGKDRRKNKK